MQQIFSPGICLTRGCVRAIRSPSCSRLAIYDQICDRSDSNWYTKPLLMSVHVGICVSKKHWRWILPHLNPNGSASDQRTTGLPHICLYIEVPPARTTKNRMKEIQAYFVVLCNTTRQSMSLWDDGRYSNVEPWMTILHTVYELPIHHLLQYKNWCFPESEHRLARTNDSDSTCTIMRTRLFSLTAFIVNVIRLKPASVYRHKCSAYLSDAIGSTITEPNVECR